jgi:hypothetical protein
LGRLSGTQLAGRQTLVEIDRCSGVDIDIGREAGLLLGKAGSGDAPDATVVVVAETGDRVLTGDPSDIERLVQSSGRSIFVVAC